MLSGNKSIETLKTLGNEWIKGENHRIYFDVLDFYPGADELSNNLRRKLREVKLWYDVKTGSFHWKTFDRVNAEVEAAIAAIKSAATEPEPEVAAAQPVETAQPPVAAEYTAKFAEAQAAGRPILLHYHMEPCNDDGEECDLDSVETYALPNGTTKTERSHSW